MTDGIQAPPYPAETRAKGWRFELDYERIEQSDTWGLAAEVPMAQHVLLMMWTVAWQQVPCGSFPDDENLIRAKCRIPVEMWPKLRHVLMRGWSRFSDGRLYHPTISERVLEMNQYRSKEAARQAGHRAKRAQSDRRPDEVLCDQQRNGSYVTRDTIGNNDTGTGTGTGTIDANVIFRPNSPLTDYVQDVGNPGEKAVVKKAAGPAARFDEFWAAWPKNERKQDKKACQAKWKLRQLDAVADTILADIQVKRQTKKWNDGFVEAPLVYLNNSRWEDGVKPLERGQEVISVGDWWDTKAGVEKRAKELGFGPWQQLLSSGQTYHWQRYVQDVKDAARKAGETVGCLS